MQIIPIYFFVQTFNISTVEESYYSNNGYEWMNFVKIPELIYQQIVTKNSIHMI